MKKYWQTIVCSLSVLGMVSCSSNNDIVRSTVPELDLTRYVGHWYEIARFDHSFERGLVGCTAYYEINSDGTIAVLNSGYKESFDGKFKQAEGKARRPDPEIPGQLEVSFFWNFYSEYNVMELADDYRYALVGSKSDKYLWILSRTPQMQKSDIDYLLQCADALGYDTSKLIWVPQSSKKQP